jgi:hypothetical protein
MLWLGESLLTNIIFIWASLWYVFSYVLSDRLFGRISSYIYHTNMASGLYEFSYVLSGDLIERIPFYKYHTYMAPLLCEYSYVPSDYLIAKNPFYNITFIWLVSFVSILMCVQII